MAYKETTPSAEAEKPVADSTIFERVWNQPGGHLFKSEWHGVMVVADIFPKLPLQVVIAPSTGEVGKIVHFSNLPRRTRLKLHEVSDAMGEKMLPLCDDNQRVITHTEGVGVPDHAHIVKFIAEPGHGQRLYNGRQLGNLAVQDAVRLLTFSEEETRLLEDHLDEIDAIGAVPPRFS